MWKMVICLVLFVGGCASAPPPVEIVTVDLPVSTEAPPVVIELPGIHIAPPGKECHGHLAWKMTDPDAPIGYTTYISEDSEVMFYVDATNPKHKPIARFIGMYGKGMMSRSDPYRFVCLAGPLDLSLIPSP